MQRVEEQFVGLGDGAQLWTAVSGSGTPVVLCHGGPGLWDYLTDVAALLDHAHTVIRFEQRGCGRSTGRGGPFTVAQAVNDLDRVRRALGIDRWGVLGHSWGAELGLRYAAEHPEQATAVAYAAGIGAGTTFREAYLAERDRRLGGELPRWRELDSRIRTPEEEREWCLLQWRPDFSPAGDPAAHAEALWQTRPAGVEVNALANRQLSTECTGDDLLALAQDIWAPVTMLLGADDPRPWTATDELLGHLKNARRVVLDHAGHAPWRERPADFQALALDALRPGRVESEPDTR
ncbi:alpha/beta fold hydrolase [Geodermatophilus sp. DSM 44513]|uniref:alpha/beta fold hydrolase n=1 Tax=Geodermatophilus sp. DSM 44513 TaxID=1528104 RepID=UPI00127E4D9B|nr:alpha/beta hydrolase [Geodermatophilus sp. DSM 44513]WNV74313.1 alpha/beta hydrolase [Geodermatophilus sp. DSM 44513]